MVDIRFDVSELNRLVADLGQAGPQAAARAALAVAKTAHSVEATAKQFCPVDTGNLKNSISTSITAGGLEAEIGPTANYGGYVEFGTSRMAPHAYMGPALDRHTPDFVQAMDQIGGEVL